MPYAPSADDATNPLDSTDASTAAAEFRTLKEKINKLFLLTAFDDAANTVGIERGLFLVNYGSPTVLQGLVVGTNRDAGTGTSIAGTISGVLGNDVTVAAGNVTVGLIVEQWTSELNSNASSVHGIMSLFAGLVQQNDAGQAWSRGLQVSFNNRSAANENSTNTVVAGLGDNLYNKKAIGISIASQRRSLAGEHCGWVAGIRFEDYCLDNNADDTTPVAIDFTGLANCDADAEPVHFNFAGGRIVTIATDNAGSVTRPTTLGGFIRVSVNGVSTWGIPICSLPLS